MLGRLFKLAAVCTFQAGNIAGIFDHRNLHTKTDTQVRYLVFAGILHRLDLAFDTALTKATGDEDGIDIIQTSGAVAFNLFRIDILDVDAGAGMNTRVDQCLRQRLVSFG